VNGLFTTNSSQIACADVLRRQILSKKEQIEWLKKRDAAPSADEKCKLMEARIKALQELVW
jgi:hypothetical protein